MNTFEYQRAVRASSLPANVKLALFTLSTYYSPNRAIRPAVDRLARECGVSQRQMRKTLSRAVDFGWLDRIERKGTTTRYRLKTPESDDRGVGTTVPPTPEPEFLPTPELDDRGGRNLSAEPPTPPLKEEETREETTTPTCTREKPGETSPSEPVETPHTLDDLHEVWRELFFPDPIPHHLLKSRGRTYGQLSSALYALADAGDTVKSLSALYRHHVTTTYADPTDAQDVTPEAIREAYKRARGVVAPPVYLVAKPDPVKSPEETARIRAMLREAKRELFGFGGEDTHAA